MALWWWHFHLSLKSHTFARISGSREEFSNKKSKTYKIIRVYCLHRTRTNLFNILILILYTHLSYWWDCLSPFRRSEYSALERSMAWIWCMLFKPDIVALICLECVHCRKETIAHYLVQGCKFFWKRVATSWIFDNLDMVCITTLPFLICHVQNDEMWKDYQALFINWYWICIHLTLYPAKI